MANRPLRLPLQVGTSALNNFGVGFALIVPSLLLCAGSVYALTPLGIIMWGVVASTAAYAVRRGWRVRPSDLAIDDEGLCVRGGIDDGLTLRWEDIADASLDAYEDKKGLVGKSHRLVVSKRGGRKVVLSETDDVVEGASLREIAEVIHARVTPPSEADAASTAPDPIVPRCAGCGVALPPDDGADLRCRGCSAPVTLPDEVRARIAKGRELSADLVRVAVDVRSLLDQPGATSTTAFLIFALVPMALAWPVTAAGLYHVYSQHRLHTGLALGGIVMPFLLIADGFCLVRARLVDRRALGALTFSHAAQRAAREGDPPSCHQCGGPLPESSRDATVVRCVWCSADNVTALDVRRPARAGKAARSLDAALEERARARAYWRRWTYASLPFLLASGLLLRSYFRPLADVTATSDALALEPVAALPVRAPDPGVVVAQTVAGDPRAALVLRAQRLAIAAHDETIDHASTSPDGLHIAFVRRSSGANEHVIVIPTDKMDQDERSFAPLSAFGTPSDEPAWSPDARRLAFVLGAAPLRQIAIVAMDRPVPRDPAGAPAPSVVADPGPKAFMRDDHAPTFSPDGVWVSFLSARDASSDGVHDVFVMRIDGEEVRRLTSSEHDCTSARWAADGWIYFASKDSFYRVKPR